MFSSPWALTPFLLPAGFRRNPTWYPHVASLVPRGGYFSPELICPARTWLASDEWHLAPWRQRSSWNSEVRQRPTLHAKGKRTSWSLFGILTSCMATKAVWIEPNAIKYSGIKLIHFSTFPRIHGMARSGYKFDFKKHHAVLKNPSTDKACQKSDCSFWQKFSPMRLQILSSKWSQAPHSSSSQG